ncbi:hypothetical protein [Paenarthrobacter nicotinovorans]|uniref:hypothetical protein n=1 Tax=Paenarthrobacter nicotinovorans TaxID=29320 RepID=UPI003B85FF4D
MASSSMVVRSEWPGQQIARRIGYRYRYELRGRGPQDVLRYVEGPGLLAKAFDGGMPA